METTHKSALEKAREAQQLRQATLDELLEDLRAARAHVAEIEAAVAELSGSVPANGATETPDRSQNGARRHGSLGQMATNPDRIAYIVGQHPEGISVGPLVKAVRELGPSASSAATLYGTVYRMAGKDDGRLHQRGDLYFLPAKETP